MKHIDADLPTLHIRCGSDIQGTLGEAGFGGDFVEFADPFCCGPVHDLSEAEQIEKRAAFIAAAFQVEREVVDAKQHAGYAALRRLDDYQRVVLWFEHDTYDQLILAYLLMRIGARPPRSRVELISIDAFPGIERFIGLGQLDAAQLAALWPRRSPVSAAQTLFSAEVWAALTARDPDTLHTLADAHNAPLPMMARALARHLRELPDLHTGLSLTERLTLEIARDLGPLRIGRAFGELTARREPLPWLGDIMFAWIVRRLGEGETPLLQLSPAPDPLNLDRWGMRTEIELTDAGRRVLVGELHYLDLNPTPRWVGGIPLPGNHGCWCWDTDNDRPSFRR